MSQDETIKPDQGEPKQPEAAPAAPGSGGTGQQAPKKKLSLDIEEIGEVLERKISP